MPQAFEERRIQRRTSAVRPVERLASLNTPCNSRPNNLLLFNYVLHHRLPSRVLGSPILFRLESIQTAGQLRMNIDRGLKITLGCGNIVETLGRRSELCRNVGTLLVAKLRPRK